MNHFWLQPPEEQDDAWVIRDDEPELVDCNGYLIIRKMEPNPSGGAQVLREYRVWLDEIETGDKNEEISK